MPAVERCDQAVQVDLQNDFIGRGSKEDEPASSASAWAEPMEISGDLRDGSRDEASGSPHSEVVDSLLKTGGHSGREAVEVRTDR